MRRLIQRYVGTRSFYSSVLAIVIPIMVQMGITNLVNLLDNVMVGRLGTESMSGVSIVNQFIFIFNLLVFGALAAGGIFSAQFYGAGDVDGVRYAFRFKLLLILLTVGIASAIFLLFGDGLINTFLHEGSTEGDIELAFTEAKRYLLPTVAGLLPTAIAQVYASSLRETGAVVPPMVASLISVGTNFTLNLILIFGLFGFPAMGVVGAAVATVIARVVEVSVLVIWAHTHTRRLPFLKGAYRSVYIPLPLLRSIAIKGLPLMLNEFLFATATTLRNQCYSTRGLDALAATSITTTVLNLFSVLYMSMGSSIAVIVGNKLGAGMIEDAKDTDRKMIALSVTIALSMGVLLFALSPFIPLLYDVGDGVRALASFMLTVTAIYMPAYAFCNASYFTIRSGGRVLLTMMLDSGFMTLVVVPVSLSLAHLTGIDVRLLFILSQGLELVKVVICATLLKKANWANRFVNN